MDFKSVLKAAISAGCPDIHLQVASAPILRQKNGHLEPLSGAPILTQADLEALIKEITTEAQRQRFAETHELDFSLQIESARFRVNLYEERNGPAIALRVISEKIPTLEEIGLGDTAKMLASLPNGLVLVTGPAGMGKSTTLAALIDYINTTKADHIITIEDPIEYVFANKQSLITQREVAAHTHSFANAIRAALREDPDVVMVGEMRDLETIAAAITLAETGHLVLSTLHTADAAQTVDRMINVFPAYEQQQIRTLLGNTLKGVISQVLVPKADGQGRIAAREVMLVNDAVRNCIQKGESHQIYSMIQLNAQEGMILMDQALEDLVREGKITKEVALSKATDVQSLSNRLNQ
jgi:twitching motility protein PilT